MNFFLHPRIPTELFYFEEPPVISHANVNFLVIIYVSFFISVKLNNEFGKRCYDTFKASCLTECMLYATQSKI